MRDTGLDDINWRSGTGESGRSTGRWKPKASVFTTSVLVKELLSRGVRHCAGSAFHKQAGFRRSIAGASALRPPGGEAPLSSLLDPDAAIGCEIDRMT